jgi:predicted nucleic acid-binding protein
VIVVDASVILEVLLRRPNALRIEERIFADRETLHAPHLLDLEVAQVLRRYVTRREMSAERGETSLTLLGQLPIRRYPHEPFLARVWALRENLTAYDGAYVSLAEALRATLLTCDARLAAASGNHAKIELIED